MYSIFMGKEGVKFFKFVLKKRKDKAIGLVKSLSEETRCYKGILMKEEKLAIKSKVFCSKLRGADVFIRMEREKGINKRRFMI